MTASVTQDYSTAGRNHNSQYLSGSLVAHTVAERRARAEALDAERRRKRQAKLEASEAALQAACQRAQSLRAARSAELRSKEEEKRARVTERRKLLEKVCFKWTPLANKHKCTQLKYRTYHSVFILSFSSVLPFFLSLWAFLPIRCINLYQSCQSRTTSIIF